VRFEPSEEGAMINGVIVDVDDNSGKAVSISRVFERVAFKGQFHDDC
jgi:calcineurin-like phosphoesterase